MPKHDVLIKLENAIVDVKGFYTKAERSIDPMTPDSSSEYELYAVMFKGVDIRPCLNDEVIYDLEQRCLTLIEN